MSSLGFIHDLRFGLLDPDNVRGTPLDMDQYTRLFGTARIPTQACISQHYSYHQSIIEHTFNRMGAGWLQMTPLAIL